MTGGESSSDLRERTASAYIVWPLAVLDLLRDRPDATDWSRVHVRQAFVFGILAALGYLVLLALPLLIVLAIPGVGLTPVVWIYALGLFADLIGAFALFGLAMTFREKTLHGELFTIPLVSPIADWLARLTS
ncbi:MAG TPA: hypothetical protein VMD91_05615 [Candidatus Sulfotelmatobacter sp.]|nr:hypothetical protein [Candidatus Sulfotelmatobacter sp.]